MRTTQLLILLLSLKERISASARLVERQPQGVWPDWNPAGLLWDTLTGLDGLGKLFSDPDNWGSSETDPPPNTDTHSGRQSQPATPDVAPAPPPSVSPEPVHKIKINNNPSPLSDHGPSYIPPAVLPPVHEGCDGSDINDAGCGMTIDQLIFTTSCAGINPNQVVSVEARAQNQAIRDILIEMNSENVAAGKNVLGLRISTLYLCGVYFFAVPLTAAQISKIEKTQGVDFVRPNQALRQEHVPENPGPKVGDPAQTPVLTGPGSRPRKRDRILTDPFAWEDLRFISTPEFAPLSEAYYYYSNAGRDMTVIAVDRGVNFYHDDFLTATGQSSLLPDYICAMDTPDQPDDDDGFSTCRTSKYVGRTYGVAKKAKVMIAKVSPSLSSVVDVLVQIANNLNDKVHGRENVRGYYVMTIMIEWDNDDPQSTQRFEELLDLLTGHFQVVVVVPSGYDRSNSNSDINRWPATAGRRDDIIVVGAVEVMTERTYYFSRGGPFLTVNAPGKVRCAVNQAGNSFFEPFGTDVAAALVAGVILYLFSTEDVGRTLRGGDNPAPGEIPRRVKRFIMNEASYQRFHLDPPVIWNLLPDNGASWGDLN
ncbi:hypothetical protein MMC07_008881 [Pseudocyphellaria aurata]|nr:hypothetical protein [Pseudocyphellaria aurata]